MDDGLPGAAAAFGHRLMMDRVVPGGDPGHAVRIGRVAGHRAGWSSRHWSAWPCTATRG